MVVKFTVDTSKLRDVLRAFDKAVESGAGDPIREAAAVAYDVSPDRVTDEQRAHIKNITFTHRYGTAPPRRATR